MDRTAFDRQMMATALAVARRGLGRTAANPSVGAVIVNEANGEIIARGWTQLGGRPHAETEALRRAGDKSRGATLYVTLEPCSHHGQTGPCADAIIVSGVARVVAAIEDPDVRVAGRGFAKLRAAGLDVVTGILADEARWITLGHILRVTKQRPFIQLKLALDASGHIAAGANGKPQWVTGAVARAAGHVLRAQADAILVGIGTVVADDPELTCRLPGLSNGSPQRVIVDTNLRLPLDSKMLRSAAQGPPVIIATAVASDTARATSLSRAGATLIAGLPLDPTGHRLDLAALTTHLASQGITRLLVEGGPSLWRSFADLGLVDEVILFMANAIPGSDPAGLTPRDSMQNPGSDAAYKRACTALAVHLGSLPLKLIECRSLGPDTLWRMMVGRAD